MNLNMDKLDIPDLERLIAMCRHELEIRKSRKPFSKEDMEAALSAHLAAHMRVKKQDEIHTKSLFRHG